MVQRFIIIILILFFIINCNSENKTHNSNDYNLKTVNMILSPGRTKFVKIIENGQNKYDSITQISIGFGYPQIKSGYEVFAAKGINLKIDVIWLHNNDILVKYPKGLKIQKKDSIVQCINDFVHIFYQEKLLPDSLTGKIIKYDRIGIMDTLTAILKGNVIDLNSKILIKNAYVSLSSGLELMPNSTNDKGFYQFSRIQADNYRFKIIAPGYNEFEMDTVHLETGDIKELNIGLIKK